MSNGPTILQPCLSAMETECPERPCLALTTNWCSSEPSFSGKVSKFAIKHGWKIAFALDTGGIPSNGGQESLNGNGPDLGRTRLGRIVSAGGRQLLEKLNSARKNFPMKIFLLLLGFYTANALATILGQTGDWDVLVAGVVVAAIEGIGMLMYRKPSSLSTGRLQSFIGMINYWKAGVCLGLFVDAFKLGS
ncbi:ycf20-like protein [Fagus crenata]